MWILKVLLLSISELSCYWYLTTFLYVALEKEMATHSIQYPCLENPVDSGAWWAADHRVAQSRTRLKWLGYMHALEKEMATHSSVLAWRIPGMEDPGRLLSVGSHRVRHNWSDLAAAAAAFVCSSVVFHCINIPQFSFIFSLNKYFDYFSPFLFLFQIMLPVTNILLLISLSHMWEFLVLRYIPRNKITGWERYIFFCFLCFWQSSTKCCSGWEKLCLYWTLGIRSWFLSVC